MFRDSVGRFLDAEMAPQNEEARKRGNVGHEMWRKVGEMGLLCTDIPEEYGGAGGDFIKVGRAFIDACIEDMLEGRLDTTKASMAKLWGSKHQCRVIDECLQLFAGYGYMNEYLIDRMYTDARIQRIYGGTKEIMKEVISRAL
ncbi:acyl-CoA dehydrogenase family protein [Halopseudomonas sp.]|jgi:alkylation response protein AidB-like acyl-CoA dehydrogenase|uniref:acyl-CoA dehydrogenase family protein n=1 Tax=Halopseudomonas sp. TaxID=2901191 RepID=UPI00300166B4|tara:strand:- start:1240 stop:1668 length:429 start_codon:yes stop_codon:yes gene_type:complete